MILPDAGNSPAAEPVLSCLVVPKAGERYRAPRNGAFQISTAGLTLPEQILPLVETKTITLARQTREANPDLQTLLQNELSANHPIDPWLFSQFFRVCPEGFGTVKVVLFNDRLVAFADPDESVPVCAIDIGTTTVALVCLDPETGIVLGQASGLNAQSSWGSDVLSRIQAIREGSASTEELHAVMVAQIETLMGQACPEGCRPVVLMAAGNTAMMHSLFSLYPGLLGESPFLSTARVPRAQRGRELGFDRYPDLVVQGLPSLSAYVGADITAGIVSSQMDRTDKTMLLLDVGTNGEMALSSGGRLVSCSTAAGPAFEGAHIHQGVGGIPGAIESVSIADDGFSCTTIGNRPIVGICGSGIIDLMACLLNSGVVDEVGNICPENVETYTNCRYRDTEMGGELEFLFGDLGTLLFTGRDIREIQLAKAAIAAGIHVLLESVGLRHDAIDDFWIAGGFGGYINPVSAARIGLFPHQLLHKVVSAGNTSLLGCYHSLLNRPLFQRMFEVERQMCTIDLASEPGFQDTYVELMVFPEQE